MKSVLLTGATGFIGRRLQSALLESYSCVRSVVRPGSANTGNLVDGVERIDAELSDIPRLTQAVRETDAVIYCAGAVRGRTLDDFRPANIDGVASMVEAINCAENHAPLLLISSLAATRPEVSDYANSKYLGEQEVVEHARFPWCILRPPAVYGPGDREMAPILKLARKGIVTPTGPSGQRVSLIHVDDVATAALACLANWQTCDQQIFELHDGRENGYTWSDIGITASGGKPVSVRIPTWILKAVAGVNLTAAKLFGYAPMLTPGKARELIQPDWVCTNDALSEATGWSPELTLKKGLATLSGSQ